MPFSLLSKFPSSDPNTYPYALTVVWCNGPQNWRLDDFLSCKVEEINAGY